MGRSMGRRTIAGICSIAATLAVFAGCGGGSGNSGKTSSASATPKPACAGALAAQRRYTAAVSALGLKVQQMPLVHRATVAAEALRTQVVKLEAEAAASDRPTLGRFAVALFDQERVLKAFANHNPAEAKSFGQNINEPLAQGQRALRAICSQHA
jgi:hypothetical protein